MILVLLTSIAVPLRRALLEVASETSARETVQNELKRLVPPDAIVAQQVSIGNDDIVIRLISTSPISDSKLAEVRRDLNRRTGRDVELSLDAIASRSELALMMKRLATRPSLVPRESTVGDAQEALVGRVRAAIQEIWPSSDAPIQGFNLVLGTAGVAVEVRYKASVDLGEVPTHMVLQTLRTRLGMPDLTLKAERIQSAAVAGGPPSAPDKPRRQ